MGFCSQFRALFRKNLILWRRNLCCSLCELIYPVLLMLLIVAISQASSNETIGVQSYVGNKGDSYYFDDTTRVGGASLNLSSQMGLQAANPFSSCVDLSRFVIAYVGDNDVYTKIDAELFGSSGGTAIP